ncbi:MAG: serine/threonine-protein kinase [Planctomycetota bacterium]
MGASADHPPPPDNQPAIFLSGTDFDLPPVLPVGLAKYQGFREMARGGAAVLRSAVDTLTGRTVAIKTLLPELRGNLQEQRRFLREARVTAQLQHPGVVPVYEIGRDEREGLYFAMKRISGENYFEALKRIARGDGQTAADFPVARRLDIVIDAAMALAYAHTRGVIHRDVKPENLWVGNFGEVVLLDWGAAKVWGQPDELLQRPSPADSLALEEESPPLQALTVAGQRPGTPLYMSPEQVAKNGAIDERTDIFSTGVVLYEMLTFREPFRGRVIAETFANIASLTPPPPSEVAPPALSPGTLPAELDATILRAIAKKPADRHPTMFALIAELRDAMERVRS